VASWQLLDKLGNAGYTAKQGDAASALDSLIKEKKDASTAMAAALEKIKSTDPKAENLNQAIDSLVQAAKKADEQVKTAQAGLKSAEKEKEEAQAALTATTNVLKAGNYVDAQAPPGADATRLALEKLLADKKNSDAQVRQANTRLKEAEETIQDMTQKLVDAKQLKPGEKPVRTPRAPSQDADLSLAERYYSSGVAHYWSGDYATAEKDLDTAIRYFKDDARFFYFLGLARWQEGKREQAIEAFQKGNELEAKSRPSSAQINATLERIQGGARQAIDQTREHPQARSE
jgi:tetratricopeptide (TPR) repeat protein